MAGWGLRQSPGCLRVAQALLSTDLPRAHRAGGGAQLARSQLPGVLAGGRVLATSQAARVEPGVPEGPLPQTAVATLGGMRGGLGSQRVSPGCLCRFWGLLGRYLPPHSICSLPFVTSFCLGMGTRRVCYGQVRGAPGWAASPLVCPGTGGGLGGVRGMAVLRFPAPPPCTRCPLGPQPPTPPLTWPRPAGGGGGALVPPERPGNPAPVCRAQAGRGRAGLGEDALLPGRRLERGQLPAHPRGDPARGRARGCEVGGWG